MSLGDLYVIDAGDEQQTPRLVESLRGQRVHELTAGFKRTLILTGSGQAQSVTHTVDQLSGLDGQLAQVSFGGMHMLALTRSGQVYTLGDGSLGQLGHGNLSSCPEPRLLTQLTSKTIAQVVCGQSHSMALSEHGDVFVWGRGFEGQLGLGVQEVALCPKYLHHFAGKPIVQLGAGGNHSVALTSLGKVYCWGEALSGQIGAGRMTAAATPVEVPNLPTVKSISCGYTHTAALTEQGQMYSWGVAARGPTAASKEERFTPELLASSADEPLAQVACGGRATVVLSARGEVFSWVGGTAKGVPPTPKRVDALSGLVVSRVGCSGEVVLAFVECCISHVAPACVPLKGGTTLSVRGAGFFRSDTILLRFKHSSGAQRLVRGSYVELAVAGAEGPPERLVRAEAPDMSSEGPGTVGVTLSFDGTVFTSVPAEVAYYAEPSLVSSTPASAAVSGGTPLLLKCKPGEAIPSTDAVAIFSSAASGDTLASVACTYVPEHEAMRCVAPPLGAPVDAVIRLALDGQSAAPSGVPVKLYAVPSPSPAAPACAPYTGETRVALAGDGLFDNGGAMKVRVTTVTPPAPPPAAEPPAEEEAATGEEPSAAGAEAPAAEAPAAAEPAEGEGEGEGEAAAEAPADEEPVKKSKLKPPPPPLEVGVSVEVGATYDADAGAVVFAMPALGGVGSCSLAVALNGVDFVDVPGTLDVYGLLSLSSVTPALGPRGGGTGVELKGVGLRPTAELAVRFVRGGRVELARDVTYDAASGCVRCASPAWPVLDASAPDDGEVHIEVALNGLQFNTGSGVHFLFQDAEVTGVEPPVGALGGDVPLRLTGNGFVASPDLKVRFTKTDVEPAESLEVAATVADDGAIECVAPAFEGAAEPFDATVHVSLDGQSYPEGGGATFRYEGAAGKKK